MKRILTHERLAALWLSQIAVRLWTSLVVVIDALIEALHLSDPFPSQ
jgi:hypothetical protein